MNKNTKALKMNPTETIQSRIDAYPGNFNFFEDLCDHLRYQGVPDEYIKKVASYCWEDGHAHGYYEVLNKSWDLIEIFD